MNLELQAVKQEIKKVLRGKDQVIDLVLCTILAGGHILLEDIPGVGKTTLAVALSKAPWEENVAMRKILEQLGFTHRYTFNEYYMLYTSV